MRRSDATLKPPMRCAGYLRKAFFRDDGEAERPVRSAPASVPSPRLLPRLGRLEFVYLSVGALTRVLEFFVASIDGGYSVAIDTSVLWHPSYREVRKTKRLRRTCAGGSTARQAGPGFRRPTTGDDFECN